MSWLFNFVLTLTLWAGTNGNAYAPLSVGYESKTNGSLVCPPPLNTTPLPAPSDAQIDSSQDGATRVCLLGLLVEHLHSSQAKPSISTAHHKQGRRSVSQPA
jgi:hypothetical protein